MSLIMAEELSKALQLSNPLVPGIAIGIIGMAMANFNYPIFKGILRSRRKKYADQIIALSDEIISQ